LTNLMIIIVVILYFIME